MVYKIGCNIYNGANTPLSNLFISNYMPKANPAFSVIYIYTLSQCSAGAPPENNAAVAGALGLLESDVIKAWEYWAKCGVVLMTESGIEFTPVSGEAEASSSDNKIIASKKPVAARNIEYSPQELSVYANNTPEVKLLFALAQTYLNKILTHKDLSVIFSFYDWYRLPLDVIEKLFDFCVSKDHTSLRYIESVAMDWADKGIDTKEKAENYTDSLSVFRSKASIIMKSFGQGSREPVKFEQEYIKKWLNSGLAMEIIEAACQRTVANTGKCNFQYCDTIITEWKNKSITTLDDIKTADEKYYAQKTNKTESNTLNKPAPKQTKKNRFVNYEQRSDWDFDELKRMEREYAKRKLEG